MYFMFIVFYPLHLLPWCYLGERVSHLISSFPILLFLCSPQNFFHHQTVSVWEKNYTIKKTIQMINKRECVPFLGGLKLKKEKRTEHNRTRFNFFFYNLFLSTKIRWVRLKENRNRTRKRKTLDNLKTFAETHILLKRIYFGLQHSHGIEFLQK